MTARFAGFFDNDFSVEEPKFLTSPQVLAQYKEYLAEKATQQQWHQSLYTYPPSVAVYDDGDDKALPVLVHGVDLGEYATRTSAELPELTSQMFEDAIEHINVHGWAQGANLDTNGQVCLQGAFAKWQLRKNDVMATCDTLLMAILVARTVEILDLMGVDAGQFISIPFWNDFPGRTKDEVIDALTTAAKKLRDEGR